MLAPPSSEGYADATAARCHSRSPKPVSMGLLQSNCSGTHRQVGGNWLGFDMAWFFSSIGVCFNDNRRCSPRSNVIEPELHVTCFSRHGQQSQCGQCPTGANGRAKASLHLVHGWRAPVRGDVRYQALLVCGGLQVAWSMADATWRKLRRFILMLMLFSSR